MKLFDIVGVGERWDRLRESSDVDGVEWVIGDGVGTDGKNAKNDVCKNWWWRWDIVRWGSAWGR